LGFGLGVDSHYALGYATQRALIASSLYSTEQLPGDSLVVFISNLYQTLLSMNSKYRAHQACADGVHRHERIFSSFFLSSDVVPFLPEGIISTHRSDFEGDFNQLYIGCGLRWIRSSLGVSFQVKVKFKNAPNFVTKVRF
jgi:hypothetical protein